MHIVILTRSVPDTSAMPAVGADRTITWDNPELVINPWDEYAVEEAVLLKEAHGGMVTAFAVGPAADEVALRYAVSAGCDAALRVWDESLIDAGPFGLARVAAHTIAQIGDVDLVVTGKEAVDLNTGAIHLGLARALDWPVLTFVAKIIEFDPTAGTITVAREVEQGRQILRSSLPAVVDVVKAINEPRYPTFTGMRKAKKLQIPVRAPGISPGVRKSAQVVVDVPAARTGAVEIIEAGTAEKAALLLVEKLEDERLI